MWASGTTQCASLEMMIAIIFVRGLPRRFRSITFCFLQPAPSSQERAAAVATSTATRFCGTLLDYVRLVRLLADGVVA